MAGRFIKEQEAWRTPAIYGIRFRLKETESRLLISTTRSIKGSTFRLNFCAKESSFIYVKVKEVKKRKDDKTLKKRNYFSFSGVTATLLPNYRATQKFMPITLFEYRLEDGHEWTYCLRWRVVTVRQKLLFNGDEMILFPE